MECDLEILLRATAASHGCDEWHPCLLDGVCLKTMTKTRRPGGLHPRCRASVPHAAARRTRRPASGTAPHP